MNKFQIIIVCAALYCVSFSVIAIIALTSLSDVKLPNVTQGWTLAMLIVNGVSFLLMLSLEIKEWVKSE